MAMDGSLNFTIPTTTAVLYGIFIAFLFFHNTILCDGSSSNVSCIRSERQALIRFKQDLHDPSHRLASWVGEDCCKWSGIVCSKITGHVHKLLLSDPDDPYDDEKPFRLSGEISPSLVDLKHLQLLDLSNSDIGGARIPEFLGSLGSLRYLNLSGTSFSGMIPYKLGNLTNLHSLDLSHLNNGGDVDYAYAKHLQWLSQLSSLRYLDMSDIDLEEASDWLEVTNSLPLVVLRLEYCNLNFIFSPTYHVNFSSLSLLDLSGNYLGNNIPLWVSNLRSLTSLYLSGTINGGPIPEGIQNLTSLVHLDLSRNSFNTSIPSWLYSLSHLEVLDLQHNQLTGTISSDIKNLTSIITLDLSYNKIQGNLPTISMGKLCKLKDIYLSGNNWNQPISQILDSWSGCLSESLQELDIRSGQISGHITNQIGRFTSLTRLDLFDNLISGPIPASLGNLSSLTFVDLSFNHIDETIPESVGQLINLEILYISNNFLEGIVSEVHFANTTKLRYLDVSHNYLLTLKVGGDWVPPFQLRFLSMDSLHLGPDFPLWLPSQKKLSDLSLSNTSLEGVIPRWIWDSSELVTLDLSHNQMVGSIPNISKIGTSHGLSPEIYLGHNNFEGPLPSISPYLSTLDLSNNSLSGSTSEFLCDKKNQPMNLVFLILANNQLGGRISNCWSSNKWQSLSVVDLSYNNFHGSIPSSFGSLNVLKSLYLHSNKLSGEFPSSLQDCSNLLTLDLGDNNFRGNIPAWIGTRLLEMRNLRLRFNQFHGHIPVQLCALTSLQILDLAYNNLTGYIPNCFNNFSAMVAKRSSEYFKKDMAQAGNLSFSSYTRDVLELVMKGRVLEYKGNLQFLSTIDVSSNFLVGHIPTEITNLSNLHSLNLSNNLLTGEIPREIGKMGALESIDFSENQLSGKIPPSMSNLNFLSYLNLSYNNLVGGIPSGTQLQSFNASSYIGNSLCGPPVTQNCSTDVETPNADAEKKTGDEDDDGILPSLYLGMGVGFVVGFWGVCGALFFNRTWRHKYFLLLDGMKDYIYVAYVLKVRWFTTKLRSYRQNQ